jgi:glycosyltransferase involved in cell wall biosynthesis
MIKVLELIDGNFIGGGQVHTLSVAKGLDKSKFNPVIAAMGGGEFENAVLNEGISFKDIYQPKVLRKKYLNPLIEYCKEEKFDILHSHGGVSGFYGRLVKKYYPEIKVIHSIHGLHYINARNIFKKYVSRTIEHYLVQYTDYTICETKQDFGNAEKIKVLNPERAAIIPNGINLRKYGNLQRKNPDFLKSFGFQGDDFIVGNISRFDVQKNQNLIIKAASSLINTYPKMKFILVGKGSLLNQSKKLADSLNLGNSLIFTGEQFNLSDYYSIFDVFVFPTFWEGMPYVLLEAMASRLPIICSDIPSLNEVIEDGKSALTINPGSKSDLIEKLVRLYDDRNLMNEISFNAHEAVKNYSEYFTIKKIEELYQEVMS